MTKLTTDQTMPAHRRWSWGIFGFSLILLGSLTIQLLGAWQDSPTRDEPSHMVDGLAYWQLGTFEFNYPHPPLAKIGSGLVLYLAGARIDADSTAWKTQDTEAVNAQVLYQGRTWTEVRWLTFIARFPVLIFWVMLVVLIWWFARKQWGEIPALVATTIVAFDPSFLGHGHLVNTDVPIATLIFAVIIVADKYFRTPKWPALFGLAVILTLALLTKFSAVILWPLIIGFGLLRVFTTKHTYSWRQFGLLLGTTIGIIAVCTIVLYQFEGLKPNRTSFPTWTATMADHEWRLPVPSYWRGLAYNLHHNEAGHRTMFLGEIQTEGDWRYFPVSLLTKTPLSTLGLWLVAVLVGLTALVRNKLWRSFRFWLFVTPAAVYAGLAVTSNLNLGIRHIFPVIPFLALLVAWAVNQLKSWPRSAPILALLVAASVIPVAAVAYPNTIGYFNAAAGGTANGQRWFVDSNLDWGQDAWRVANYLHTNEQIRTTQVSLFGTIPNSLFAPGTTPVPNDKSILSTAPANRVFVSSALLYPPDREYQWILGLSSPHEIGSIGSTVHIFRF